LKGFSVMIRQSYPTMRSRHKGVDNTHSEVGGKRNPQRGNSVQNHARKCNPIKEPSQRGFDGDYEIMSRCIAFGSSVASSYAQSNNITSE
jgi:hypothetical protein